MNIIETAMRVGWDAQFHTMTCKRDECFEDETIQVHMLPPPPPKRILLNKPQMAVKHSG